MGKELILSKKVFLELTFMSYVGNGSLRSVEKDIGLDQEDYRLGVI